MSMYNCIGSTVTQVGGGGKYEPHTLFKLAKLRKKRRKD